MKRDASAIGNEEIMNREKVAFLSSRKVPPAAVMLSLDWAAKVRDAGICVIGGFQSALEKDVLRVSEESAVVRNRFILSNCTSAIFASIDPEGALDRLLAEFPNLPYGVLADVR